MTDAPTLDCRGGDLSDEAIRSLARLLLHLEQRDQEQPHDGDDRRQHGGDAR